MCDRLHVFFRAPPEGAGSFLLLDQEKGTKQKATDEHVLRTSMCYGFARSHRGSRTLLRQELIPDAWRQPAHPCAGVRRRDVPPARHDCPGSPHGELARILRATLGHFRRPLAVFEGPHSARVLRALHGLWCFDIRCRRPWMAGREAEPFPRRCMTPGRAVDRASKARMSEAMDGRVRAGARSASIEGSFSDTTSLKPSCPAQWSFVPFCRNRKGLARRRRAKPI